MLMPDTLKGGRVTINDVIVLERVLCKRQGPGHTMQSTMPWNAYHETTSVA